MVPRCLLQVEKPISKDIGSQHAKGKVKSPSLKYQYVCKFLCFQDPLAFFFMGTEFLQRGYLSN